MSAVTKLRRVLFTGGAGGDLLFGAAALRGGATCRGVVGAGTGSCSGECCYCIWF